MVTVTGKIERQSVGQGNKIELFYFLATGWLGRALSAFSQNLERPERWWGGSDWRSLLGLKPKERTDRICRRFRDELGYKHVTAWPIFQRMGGGRVMFDMIHATDHDEAPKLMYRAYRHASGTPDTSEQFMLNLEKFNGLAASFSEE